ncbi:hypothetical protein ACF07U_05850 [Streptomyces californicus]|uniref:hypothetical protein n=1 Tax=Streptomyces californicus TaxID=67351 RepID=UPI0036F56E70
MKRVHFTAEDLARTRVAPTIGVAAETFDSVRMLRDRDAGPAFRGRQASLRGRLGEQAGPLAALMPTRGPLIDAMSLMGAAPSIDGAVDTWMGLPGPCCGPSWSTSASTPRTARGPAVCSTAPGKPASRSPRRSGPATG